MTTIKDTYQLDSKTDDSGLRTATKSANGLGSALKGIGKIGAAPFKAIHAGIGGIGKAISAAGKGLAVFGLAMNGLKSIGNIVGGALDAIRQKSPALDYALTNLQTKMADVLGPAMGALGNALTPIFEKLADVISSPEFKEFVDLITKTLIKGLQDLMPVIEGAIKFLMQIVKAFDTGDWSEVWNTIRTVAENAWNAFVAWLGPAWNTFWTVTVPAIWAEFKRIFTMAWDTFWNGIRTVAEGIWTGIKTAWDNFWGGLRDGVQSALDWLQGKSGAASTAAGAAAAAAGAAAANAVSGRSGALPGQTRRFARGGIVGSPMMAMVGDAPRRKGGEVVAPLTDLMGMIQQAIGGGGPTINIYGPFGPGYTPAQAGAQAAAGYANQMRARGAKI